MEHLNEELYALMVPFSKLNYYFGIDLLLPPKHLLKSKRTRLGWKTYEYFSAVYIAVGGISMATGAYRAFVSSKIILGIFLLFVGMMQIFQPIAKLYLGVKQAKFKQFLVNLNQLLINNKQNPIFKDGDCLFHSVYSRHYSIIRTFTFVYMLMVEGGAAVYLLEGWVSSPPTGRRDRMLGYAPEIIEESEWWYLMFYTYGTCQFFMVNGKTVAIDCFYWSLTAILRCQLLFIKSMLGALLRDDLKEVDSRKLKRKFDWWVRQHQATLECCSELKQLLSTNITIEYLLCLINIVFCIFCVPQAYFLTISQKLAVIGSDITHLIMMYNFCNVSDYWEEYSGTIAESAYDSKHISGPAWVISHLKIIFINSTRPVRLAVFGGFPVSRKLLLYIIQGIYTYYTALSQISSGRKLNGAPA